MVSIGGRFQPLAVGALNLPRLWVIERQIGSRAQLVSMAARMGRFFLHGTFGGAALRDIGERVVWNRQAMGRAISSCFVVERPLVRVLCSRRLARFSARTVSARSR